MLTKYKDKSFLCRYDLNVKIFEKFNLKVYDVIPIRKVFILCTNKGRKVLKKIDYTEKELNFIYRSIKYIKNKFSRIFDFVKTTDGKIYTIFDNNMYCIMELVEGRECNFDNPIDLSIISKGLGEFHKASEGLKSNLYNKCLNGKIIDVFKRRIQEIKFFKNIANMNRGKKKFDNIFLKEVDYYINEIEKSINILEKSNYYKLCSEEDKVVLCHNDLAHHNILINDNQAYFIDLDYAVIDLKVHDLCNFINKVVKNFAFDIEKANNILSNYCIKNSLDKRELEVLYGMITFPQDFYSICKDYYTKRKDWSEEIFLNKIKKKVNYYEDRKEFLNFFKDLKENF